MKYLFSLILIISINAESILKTTLETKINPIKYADIRINIWNVSVGYGASYKVIGLFTERMKMNGFEDFDSSQIILKESENGSYNLKKYIDSLNKKFKQPVKIEYLTYKNTKYLNVI